MLSVYESLCEVTQLRVLVCGLGHKYCYSLAVGFTVKKITLTHKVNTKIILLLFTV